MQLTNKPIAILAGVSLLAVTACTDPASMTANDPNQKAKQGALLGGIIGATLGGLTNKNSKQGILRGAVVGAGAGALVGNGLDKQEADLRRDLPDNVQINNTGDRLIVTLPQDILFATDSDTLRPDLQSDIHTVAANLNTYANSTVQVIGHTDNVGDAAYNLGLSSRRAQSVANVLISAGVSSSRVQISGRGEDQPIASNLDENGRRQNRRVEIVILPNAQ